MVANSLGCPCQQVSLGEDASLRRGESRTGRLKACLGLTRFLKDPEIPLDNNAAE